MMPARRSEAIDATKLDHYAATLIGGDPRPRTEEQVSTAKAEGKTLPKFYGHALLLLPSGPSYIDMSAWHRPKHNFYSGNALLHNRAAAAAARDAKPAAEPT